MVHGSPLANTFPLVERKFAVGSLGKSIAKVDFWTTHDAPWSHGPQITDAGSSPPRVRVGPHASALAAGVVRWDPMPRLTGGGIYGFWGGPPRSWGERSEHPICFKKGVARAPRYPDAIRPPTPRYDHPPSISNARSHRGAISEDLDQRGSAGPRWYGLPPMRCPHTDAQEMLPAHKHTIRC